MEQARVFWVFLEYIHDGIRMLLSWLPAGKNRGGRCSNGQNCSLRETKRTKCTITSAHAHNGVFFVFPGNWFSKNLVCKVLKAQCVTVYYYWSIIDKIENTSLSIWLCKTLKIKDLSSCSAITSIYKEQVHLREGGHIVLACRAEGGSAQYFIFPARRRQRNNQSDPKWSKQTSSQSTCRRWKRNLIVRSQMRDKQRC